MVVVAVKVDVAVAVDVVEGVIELVPVTDKDTVGVTEALTVLLGVFDVIYVAVEVKDNVDEGVDDTECGIALEEEGMIVAEGVELKLTVGDGVNVEVGDGVDVLLGVISGVGDGELDGGIIGLPSIVHNES